MNGPHAQSARRTSSVGELGSEDARSLFGAMLAGELAPHELAPIVDAWRARRASVAEVTGFMRALDAHALRLDSPSERPRPVVLPAYRGTRRQANLTALVALLLQRYEVPVLVHGPRSRSASDATLETSAEAAVVDPAVATLEGRSGQTVTTADVLWELGIEPAASAADAGERLRHGNIAYLSCALLAPGLARLLAPPAPEPPPAVLQTLALLIDPFGGSGYRVIGAGSADERGAMREFLLATRTDALLFEGAEGEPFADPRSPAHLEHIAEGVATPCADGEAESVTAEPSLPGACDAVTTAAWITDVLTGTRPVPPPIILQLGCCLAGARRQGA